MAPIEQKLVRAPEGSDDQCRVISPTTGARCPYLAVEGQTNCVRHSGSVMANKEEKKATAQYRLQIWQERLEEFAENEKAKSLREEIGILRILMETIVNKCTGPNDLILYSPKISELAAKIEKLVSSCHRIEHSMGSLMDKATALAFAGQVVEIISTHIQDPDIIDAISTGIITALSNSVKDVQTQ